ncbi:MAG: hypothetical protein KBB11_09000 [Bacteroidales bacterium]|nr:hypothetical protein [Bacteroidales bacterium]HOY38124.1 hypothetical protein [Bacteroidales bacterium]HQP03752.1 hypothetical protein [Bacteroidales bacterium]
MKVRLLVFIAVLAVLWGCNHENEPQIYTVSGKVQKGPFTTGTNIILNELTTSLAQTGRAFTTTMSTNDGSFSLGNIELESELALVTATGYYFNELYGELSPATLTLSAITNLSANGTVNINVMTHVIRARTEVLVSTGMSFRDASEQAQSEFLAFLNAADSGSQSFDDLDISQNNSYNASLLAFSVILQRYTNKALEKPQLTAELTQLLANISTDFAPDGQITNQAIIDTLLYNISNLNLYDIRENIAQHFAGLGITADIPDFETYVDKFQELHSHYLYQDFYYPTNASPEPIVFPHDEVPNLLALNVVNFTSQATYCIAAVVPLYSSLRIQITFTSNPSGFTVTPGTHGWHTERDGNVLNMYSQRRNTLMSYMVGFEGTGSALIEYFENGETSPSFTKTITWQ